MDDINERIKLLRKTLELSQESFGKEIGVTKVAISLIESGKNKVTDTMAKAICHQFNVDYIWLTEGTGNMFLEIPKDLLDEVAIQYNLSERDLIIIEKYMKLPRDKREIILDYLQTLFSK